MWKWRKPSPYKKTPFRISSCSFDYTRFVRSTVIIVVGRHWQGGTMAPSSPENSFILTIEATKNRGWAPHTWKLKMAGEPPGALPWKNSCLCSWLSSSESHLLGSYQERGQEYFQGGASGKPFFTFQDSIFGHFNGQNERISRARGVWPSPANGCLRPWLVLVL